MVMMMMIDDDDDDGECRGLPWGGLAWIRKK